jgi:hypothetical protein
MKTANNVMVPVSVKTPDHLKDDVNYDRITGEVSIVDLYSDVAHFMVAREERMMAAEKKANELRVELERTEKALDYAESCIGIPMNSEDAEYQKHKKKILEGKA